MPNKNKMYIESSNRYKKRKQKRTIRKAIVIGIACVISFGAFSGVKAGLDERKSIRLEQQKLAEERRIAEEKRRKEEEEAKKRMIGVNHEAKKYSYDARIIQEKLNNYDYSNNGEKIVFLTFDDGSSTTVTPQVLDTLKQNNVKATFFVTGNNIERGGDSAKQLVKRTFDEGHAIANHSYSHDYKYLYPGRTLNLENFKSDLSKTDDMLNEILGPYFSTRVLRCPGGHMSWKGMDELDAYLDDNNMASIDWNALNADAQGRKKSAPELVDYAISSSEGKEIVVLLMHDTYGKEETAKALNQIIQYYKDNGYSFKTLV